MWHCKDCAVSVSLRSQLLKKLQHKQGDKCTGQNQVKKPRRAEVNYCPDNPAGENKETLEEERVALQFEVKKKNNQQVVKERMEKTFAYRRHEVIEDMPFIADFKRRWPSLFSEHEACAEFTRITTVPLLSKFMSQLDDYSTKLTRVFQRKGEAAGHKMRNIMAVMGQNDSIETRRACILKALAVYVNEEPEKLIKEYLDVDADDARKMMDQTGADAVDPPEDVGIIIEGVQVLQYLGDAANACALLLGLIYTMNLSYPPDLKYTFEVLQKILMELDGNKLSTKAQVLKNKLLE